LSFPRQKLLDTEGQGFESVLVAAKDHHVPREISNACADQVDLQRKTSMNAADPKYLSTQAVADALFEQRIKALSVEFRRIVEQTAARGFSMLPGSSIGAMSDATVQSMRATSEELLGFYERAFGDGPPDGPETLSAVRTHLAEHLARQMNSLAETYRGALASYAGGRAGSDDEVTSVLQSVLHRVRTRVDGIVARNS
jgi:hypothetical protein